MNIPARELSWRGPVGDEPSPVDVQTADGGGGAVDQREQMLRLLSQLPGVRAFPCQSGKKTPAGKWKHDNTEDPAQVRQIFDKGFNVGLYIGKKIYVIDVEGPNKGREASRAGQANFAKLQDRLGALPPTATAETPSGGWHFYLALPDGIELPKVDPLLGAIGVEGRTGDHYVVAPGSVVGGVEYRFAEGSGPSDVNVAELPAVWIEAIKATSGAKKAATKVAKVGAQTEKGGKKPVFQTMAVGCSFVRHGVDDAAALSEPEWYAWLSLAGHCEDGDRIAREFSSRYPRYDASETENKLSHAVDATPPRTCDNIATSLLFEGCKRCPFRAAKMSSPIALGYQELEVVKVQADAVYLLDTRQYLHLPTGRVAAWKSYDESLRVELGKGPHNKLLSLKTTPRVWGLDYLPGVERLIVGDNANTWRLSGANSIEGDPSIFLEFLKFLIPDQTSREHLLDYLSHLLRHPDVKIKSGNIITGPQGVGKSTLAKIIIRLFGANARMIDGPRLGDRFNADLANCQVLLAEEADHGGKYETYEKLKTLLTEEMIDVDEKCVKVTKGRTPRGVFVLSNHTNPLALATDDRRFAVLATVEAKADDDVYARIYAAIEDNAAIGAFAWFLKTRACEFNPNVAPPMTSAKEEATKASRVPLVQIITELLEEDRLLRELLTLDEMRKAVEFSGWSVDRALAPQRLRTSMREAGCIPLKKTRINGINQNLWAIKNVEKWQNASPAAIREERSRYVGTSIF